MQFANKDCENPNQTNPNHSTSMNIRFLCHALRVLALLLSAISAASAQSTAFTYQGRLNEGGTPAAGLYDLRGTLHDAVSGGAPLIRPVTNSAVAVSNGLFTIALDFGAKVFNGQDRWLEISVRTNGGGAFTTLAPRQPMTPSPSALYALAAGVADAVDTSAITTASLSNNAVTSAKILDGTIAANDLSPALAGGTFWRLDGNAGTTAGTHFLGTSDDQPLELKVAGKRAFRIEPNTNNAPNLIGGSAANAIAPGVEGATIAGGGTLSPFGFGGALSNQIFASYGFIGGGSGNSIEGFSRFGVIGGGFSNVMSSQNLGSVIGGGLRNRLLQTTVGSVEPANVIAGGRDNFMDGICNNSVIGGGKDNAMITQCSEAVIGGGTGNKMRSGRNSVIAGGETNEIWHAQGAAVGGGRGNSIVTNSFFSVISGGVRNIVRMNSPFSSISGGSNNVAGAAFATIPGGQRNEAAGDFSFAAGRRARALHDGSFVWADQGSVSTGTEFMSSSSNQFLIRASGGVGLNTTNPAARLTVAGAGAFNNLAGASVLLDNASASGRRWQWHALDDGRMHFVDFDAGASRMLFDTNGNVGIGEGTPGARLDVRVETNRVALFNRTGDDGVLVNWQRDGGNVGSVSVAAGVVSYNAFTGSHYGWTDETIDRGLLVSMTGENRRQAGADSEVIYGITLTRTANDPRCLGAYLAREEPKRKSTDANPHQIMAVGNGEMWVTDDGGDIEPGDFLISSRVPGCAMKDDPDRFSIGNICARSASRVRWADIEPDARGIKRQKISVLFESFQRDSRAARTANSSAVMPISHRLNASVAPAIQGLSEKLEAENDALRSELTARDGRLAELERRLTALESHRAVSNRNDTP